MLRGYRKLLRSSRKLFANDTEALAGASKELRAQFEKHRYVTDAVELDALVKDIDDVFEMMEVNLVQARLNERGNYEVGLAGKAVEGDGDGCLPKYEALHNDSSGRE